jgi:predicted secreted protein
MDKPGPMTTKTVEVSIEEVRQKTSITRDVAMHVGEVLALILGSGGGSTGYAWTDAQIDDPAVVQQTSHDHVAPSGPLIGAPSKDVWKFTALKAGKATIATDLRGPGTAGEIACSFKVNVTVG